MALAAHLNLLAHALTGKNLDVSAHVLNELIEGNEIYLPDGGYSRIVVSLMTGNARLTSNSRGAVKTAWAGCCRELVAELEVLVDEARKTIDPDYRRECSE